MNKIKYSDCPDCDGKLRLHLGIIRDILYQKPSRSLIQDRVQKIFDPGTGVSKRECTIVEFVDCEHDS